MLIVTVDLVPGGSETHRRTIASMRIANTSNLSEISDYVVGVTEGANPLTGTKARIASIAVKNHDHRQAVWSLVAKAADAATRATFKEIKRPGKG